MGSPFSSLALSICSMNFVTRSSTLFSAMSASSSSSLTKSTPPAATWYARSAPISQGE